MLLLCSVPFCSVLFYSDPFCSVLISSALSLDVFGSLSELNSNSIATRWDVSYAEESVR